MGGVRSFVSGMSLVLALFCGLLGGLLYLQWQADVSASFPQSAPVEAEDPAQNKVEAIPPFVPVPLRSLSEITDRPLFTEGRTPPEKKADNPQAGKRAAPLRLKLEGVAITPESKVAIISDLQTNELLRLSQGMSHGDWKVINVSEESVTIQQGSREINLSLEIEEKGATPGGGPRVPFKLPVRPPARR